MLPEYQTPGMEREEPKSYDINITLRKVKDPVRYSTVKYQVAIQFLLYLSC